MSDCASAHVRLLEPVSIVLSSLPLERRGVCVRVPPPSISIGLPWRADHWRLGAGAGAEVARAARTGALGACARQALPTVHGHMQERWSHVMQVPDGLTFHEQFVSLLRLWNRLAHAGDAAVDFSWTEAWRAIHCDPRFAPARLWPAWWALHSLGSIRGSEAICESVGSILKRYSQRRTGRGVGAAVEATLLRCNGLSGVGEKDDAFILRTWCALAGGDWRGKGRGHEEAARKHVGEPGRRERSKALKGSGVAWWRGGGGWERTKRLRVPEGGKEGKSRPCCRRREGEERPVGREGSGAGHLVEEG